MASLLTKKPRGLVQVLIEQERVDHFWCMDQKKIVTYYFHLFPAPLNQCLGSCIHPGASRTNPLLKWLFKYIIMATNPKRDLVQPKFLVCSYGKKGSDIFCSGLGHFSSDLCYFDRDGSSVAGCQGAAVLRVFFQEPRFFSWPNKCWAGNGILDAGAIQWPIKNAIGYFTVPREHWSVAFSAKVGPCWKYIIKKVKVLNFWKVPFLLIF